jgi:hypothetical protein
MDADDSNHRWGSGGADRAQEDPALKRSRLFATALAVVLAPRARAIVLAPCTRAAIPSEKESLLRIERDRLAGAAGRPYVTRKRER